MGAKLITSKYKEKVGGIVIFVVLFKEEIASSIHKTLAINKKVVFVILKFPKILERKIHILWKIYDYNYINVDIK